VFRALFRQVGLPDAIRTDNGCPFASTGIHWLLPSECLVDAARALERLAERVKAMWTYAIR
jgi:hypothetical protein